MRNRFILYPAIALNLIAQGHANDAALNDGANGPEPIGWRSGVESYFEISVLNLEQIKKIVSESPEDFPSVEEWVAGWRKMQSE